MPAPNSNNRKTLPPACINYGSGGFSLIEILIALVILALVTGSIFSAFSGSKGMLYSARDLATATALASSYLAAVSPVAINNITSFAPTNETELPEPFTPGSLKVAAAPPPFSRSVAMLAIDQAGKEGGPFYQISVQVSWPKKESQKILTYSSATIIRGRP